MSNKVFACGTIRFHMSATSLEVHRDRERDINTDRQIDEQINKQTELMRK